jgi:hypothetical protein
MNVGALASSLVPPVFGYERGLCTYIRCCSTQLLFTLAL